MRMTSIDWTSVSDGAGCYNRRVRAVVSPGDQQGLRDALRQAFSGAKAELPDDLRRLLMRIR
ncbi:MAG TPA: hypothetical protein VFL92_03875 [Sphingomonas sp.]|nr:hypothetical protein [Sphingomonas sp.]